MTTKSSRPNPNEDQPIQPEYQEKMRLLAHKIDRFFNGPDATPQTRKTAFALLVFPFGQGDDHRSNYISNADRADMLATMKEFIARAEGRYQNEPEKAV